MKFKNPISATKYKKSSHILIQVVNNKATLNGKIHTLTFLKDVTFGVLYEQIKSQDQIKRMMNSTLQQKIYMPLQKIEATCKEIVTSDSLGKFELAIANTKLSSELDQMATHCKLVILQLDDMKDLVLIIEGKIIKKTSRFNMRQTFQNLKKLMKLKASIKNVDLNFQAFFDQSQSSNLNMEGLGIDNSLFVSYKL